MYLWNVTRLAEEFRDEAVSEEEQFKYILTEMVLMYVFTDTYVMSWINSAPANNYDAIIGLISIVVVAIGTWVCFKTSQKNPRPSGFIPRYICLGIPVFVRVTAAFLLVAIIMVIAASFFDESRLLSEWLEAEDTTALDVPLLAGIEISFFYYLNRVMPASYT